MRARKTRGFLGLAVETSAGGPRLRGDSPAWGGSGVRVCVGFNLVGSDQVSIANSGNSEKRAAHWDPPHSWSDTTTPNTTPTPTPNTITHLWLDPSHRAPHDEAVAPHPPVPRRTDALDLDILEAWWWSRACVYGSSGGGQNQPL